MRRLVNPQVSVRRPVPDKRTVAPNCVVVGNTKDTKAKTKLCAMERRQKF